MSLYEFTLDFIILNCLPPNPSAPVCALGHLPLHKGGMRRYRASAKKYNLQIYCRRQMLLFLE